MSKSKVKKLYFLRKLIQKGSVLACILTLVFGWVGLSQALVIDNLGAAAVVTNSSLINASYQLNSTPAAFSALNQSTVPVNITSTGIINSTTDNNALYSTVLANNKTLFTDIALVSGSAAGSSLSSVNIQQNSAITALSRVSGTSVTSTLTNPAAGSLASLSGNSISADTTLNKTSQTAEGKLDLTFNSSHAGSATLQPANPQLSGDAGVFVGSFQHNNVISSTVMGDPFAQISGTNSIALTATGTLGSSLILKADDNSISAAFTGNNAENVLAVQTGGATSLTSSAGIANLQINSNYDWPTLVPNTSAIIEGGSSISASVQTNPFTSSSLSFDGNQLKASATGSVASNKLSVASGLNVAAGGGQTNSLNFTSGSETATTSGGLFLNNMQLNANAPISATTTDPAGVAAALSVDSRGLISSSLTAGGNSFEAIALGNDAASSISVGGATSFIATVAASNLQSVNSSPVTATASAGTLAVNLGGSAVGGGTTAIDNITGSTISVNNNTISALAVVNRDPLLVNITGTTVTDGLTQIAGVSVNNATPALASTSGISAISSQLAATGSVAASNTGAGINLLTTNYPSSGTPGSHVSDSTFTQSGNGLTSLANINEGLVAVGIKANDLDASSAVASLQNASASNATATTSGTIITGINTRQGYLGDTVVGNTNLSILVGDGNLSDGINDGNSISATAGGNINASALEATATTTMKATNVINMNGDPSNVLALSTSAIGTNQTLAEMSVLTDQRLAANTIAATTGVSQIAGIIRSSTYALSNSTLNVDGNQVTATARGNLTSNSLDFSALSVDMTTAEQGSPSTPAGTNLASMGSIQLIGPNSSVTAQIDAAAPIDATNPNAEILGKISGTGDRTNIALSVDNNSVVSAATGSTAISNLNGSGGSLTQHAPGILSGNLSIAALPTTALSIYDTAIANAVVQSNAGSVSANLATTQVYDIDADINGNRNTNSVITADNNRAVALATGLSTDVGTVLAFNTLESSAATAVQQAQSGNTTAIVGGNGGITITAWTPPVSNLINSTLSASGNTAGTEATGATATTSLSAGGADTVTLASGFGNGAINGASATISAAGVTSSSANFMLGVQQNISGATLANADDLSVLVSGGRFAGGSLATNNNFLTAQAIGGTSTANLSLNANDMTAGGTGENTVNAALSSDQRLSGAVSATLTASDVTVQAINLTTAASSTNSAEAVSASNNTLLAAGTGLTSTNALTTTATTSVLGNINGDRDLSFSGIGDVGGNGWDRLIVTNQDIAAGGTVAVTSAATTVAAAITGAGAPVAGDINGDALSVNNNTLQAQGTGANNSNTLSTTAGTSISSVSQAIMALQTSAGAVTVANTTPSATLDIAGASTDSSLSLSGNQLAATSTGLAGANSMKMSAAASITGDYPPFMFFVTSTNTTDSIQALATTAAVSANLATPQVSLGVIGAVTGSSLKVDDNILEAVANGATNNNSMSAGSGSLGALFTFGGGFAELAEQQSSAPVSATTSGGSKDLTVGGAASMSSLSLSGNSLSASASNLTGASTLTVDAQTASYGNFFFFGPGPGGDLNADRLVVNTQTVDTTGIVNGTVSAPAMALSVTGGLSQNSTAYLNKNTIASAATVAGSTNNLTNTAGTLLTSSSLIAAFQESAADAAAATTGSALSVTIGVGTTDAGVSLSDNQVTASATGLTTTNNLNVKAGSIQGDQFFFGFGGYMYNQNPLADYTDPPVNNMWGAMSAIRSEQTTSGDILATVANANLTTALTGAVTSSGVDLDRNLVQASSTAASATNTIVQHADTSTSGAPVLLGASQVISGSSAAAVTTAAVALTAGSVSGSNVSADSNTLQAVATGGTMKNYLDPGAGTSIVFFGGEDPTIGAVATEFMGDYAIASRQLSAAPVTATVSSPSVRLTVAGDITDNSAVSASGNILRAQATNLSTDNNTVTAAGTALDNISSATLSYQDVAALTGATTSGAVVALSGNGLTGAAAANSNWLVAIATGGTSTNKLDVSGLSISGFGDSLESTTTPLLPSDPYITSGYANNLLNLQSRSATVTATLADGTPGNAAGNLGISAGFGTVTGSVSVSNNLMAAEASGLVSQNSANLTSKTVIDGSGMALGSVQHSSADVIATINSGSTAGTDDARISLTATDVLTGTATQNGNALLANATANLAINSLSVSAGTVMQNLGSETTTTINAPLTDINASTAGLALQNLQQGTGAATAAITNTGIVTTLTSLNGTATVDNNTILSQARGQAAQNGLVLNAGTTLNGAASLANVQTNGGALSSTITNGTIGLTGTNVNGTTSVSGNTVQASSTANLALNSIDIAGSLAASSAIGGSIGSLTATADYVALNAQSNTAGVNSSVSSYTIRLADSISTNGTASVLNNAILADATGNSSTNTFTISPKASSNTADFAFTGYQSNTGAISSSISGASISLASTGGTGTFSATGNKIGATSIGNSSISSIRSGL